MAGTSAGAAKRKRCRCGAFAHLGDCPPHGPTARDLMERVWENIAKGEPDDCWPWTGGTNEAGYGHIGTPDGKRHLAHRLVIGATPGSVVRHSCDNPPCCNPGHLTEGTHAENMMDRNTRGRSAKGESHGRSKLKAEQIEAILADVRSSKELAPIYGVADSTIRKIRRGERWASSPANP